MAKKYDVIAMGELLIDFTMNGQSGQGNALFEACPGGAPCNVLALLNKMGKRTAFFGKVGKDQFGKLLRNTLDEVKIDTSHLLEEEKVNTNFSYLFTFKEIGWMIRKGKYYTCVCTYLSRRRQRVFLLQEPGRGYDA